jgi:hypothetical protein
MGAMRGECKSSSLTVLTQSMRERGITVEKAKSILKKVSGSECLRQALLLTRVTGCRGHFPASDNP